MAKQQSRIVSTPDTLGGDPRIEGTRLGVHHVHALVEGRELDPRTVADRYDLAVADVYRALAYYHEHPDEMAAIDERRAEREREALEDPQVVTGPEDIRTDE
jgi:uncharacterized protein (DUF433 family)